MQACAVATGLAAVFVRTRIVRLAGQIFRSSFAPGTSCRARMIRARHHLCLSCGSRPIGVTGRGLMRHRMRELAQDETPDEQQHDRPAMKKSTVHLRSVSPPAQSRNRDALGICLQHMTARQIWTALQIFSRRSKRLSGTTNAGSGLTTHARRPATRRRAPIVPGESYATRDHTILH